MSSVDQAKQTQLNNIQAKTGKTLEELSALVQKSGLSKHGEIREMLQRELGLGYGDANALVHFALKSDGARVLEAKGLAGDQVLDEIYTGPKAALRPIHDRLMAEIVKFGEFESAPKKGYVSLRRKRQFAMIGRPPIRASKWVLMPRICARLKGCSNSRRAACVITK